MKKFSLQPEEPQGKPDFLKGLNEQQRKAVTHSNGPLLIIAGAGINFSDCLPPSAV